MRHYAAVKTTTGIESLADGVYSTTTTTRYNAAGQPLSSVQKQLISQFSTTLESKSVFVSERGLTSTQWTEYSENTKRIQYSAVPSSDITAEAVTVDGYVTLHQRYIYRGYLQITCIDLTRAAHPALWYITWESPRGLGGGLDKPRSAFAPQGRAGNGVPASQPIQWFSEFNDTELGLVYYNYRHYNPVDGRWLSRDVVHCYNEYESLPNMIFVVDVLGAIGLVPIVIGVVGTAIITSALIQIYRWNMQVEDKIRERDGIVRVYVPNLYEEVSSWRRNNDKFNIFIHYSRSVTNRDELRVLFQEVQNNSKCDCIKEIKLAVHGKYDTNNNTAEMFFGTEWLMEPAIEDLFMDVKFCKDCKIIINSCYIGKSQQLRSKLNKYGCEVKLYNDEAPIL